MSDHGCAYKTVYCRKRGCEAAELCPGGKVVYRDWLGGGHHHIKVEEVEQEDAA